MSATGAGYDLSTTTYSPDGRCFQVEYANKAVEKSGTTVGIRCIDGVVLGVEKVIASRMLVKASGRRVHAIDLHAGMAAAGIAADARQLVNRGRSEAHNYSSFYGRPIPGRVLNERISGYVHTHTLYWYLRPFGTAVLIATSDAGVHTLHMVEPSGVSYEYKGAVVGKHKRGAKSELEKIKYETVTCREAVQHIANMVYKLHDDVKEKDFALELGWVCDESGGKFVRVPEELRAEAVRAAMELKQKEEMESDSDEDIDA